MKNKLLHFIMAVALLYSTKTNFAQAPNLGTTAGFALFTATGAFTNTGATNITGDVGTHVGAFTGFPPGTVTGQIHVADPASTTAATDVGVAYGYLSGLTCDSVIGTTLGNNQVLTAKVYCVGAASTLNGTLYLDAQGNDNAIFIIKINGALATGTFSNVVLINSASVCNVYWQINGSFTLNDSSVFRGTIVGNGAINLNTGATLYGRGLTTAGAINTSTVITALPSGPVITTEPSNQTVCAGSSVSFSVIASGAGLTYQWRKGATNITGATSATLTINPVTTADVATNYNVIVTGTCSPSDTSANASLTVNTSPTITTQPTGQASCAGGSVSFTVAATGTALTYQWRKGTTNLYNTGNISGATSATLTINPVTVTDVASNYNVLVSGTCAPNDVSTNVSLVLGTPPNITTEPGNQIGCVGSSASFNVVATGSGLTYQWRKGTSILSNTGNISGANSATLTINPVIVTDVASDYNVIVFGNCSPNDTSLNASLTLNNAPNITVEPGNQTACSGSSISFSVTATGSGLTYQWRKGTTNLYNTGNISGATTSTLTINPATVTDVASNYNVVVMGTCSPNANSINVSLTINTAPNITSQPTNQTTCSGGAATFSVNATGTSLSYQWRLGTTNLSNTGNISGATSATLTINPVGTSDVASNYNVIVTGTCSPAATSTNVSLSLNSAPNITTEPTNQTVCSGTLASFSVTATGAGLTYQWRKGNTNLSNSGNISGANSATLIINPSGITDASSNYNVIVAGSCSSNDSSINVSLTINTAPTIISEPSNQNACTGGSVNYSVTANGTGLSYQWRNGTTNLSNTGNISGANSATLNINPVSTSDASSNYNVIITGTCTPGTISSNVSLTVNTAANIATEPSSQTVCNGSSAIFSVSATGTAITYQWRKGTTNLSNTANISGATSATLTINPAGITDAASDYNVIVTGTCAPNDTSINVALTINTAPNIVTEPSNQTVCAGGSATFSVTANGTGLSYQWRKGTTNLSNTGSISGATSASLNINPVTTSDAASNYNVVITGSCTPIATSTNVTLTVNTAPNITTEPSNQTICNGGAVSFSVAATGTLLNYQWRKGTTNLSNTGNISGANSATLIINPATSADAASDYNVVITGTCAPNDTSINATLTISTAPTIITEPINQTICTGGTVVFSVAATGTGLTYQWRKGSVNLSNTGNISGATSTTLTLNSVNASNAASDYNVIVSGTCSPSDTSVSVSLTVNAAPNITTQPTNQTVCSGNTAGFSVAATGTSITYQWRKGNVNLTNSGNISGATSNVLLINPATVADIASDYNVIISGICSPVTTSNNVSLTVNTEPVITNAPVNTIACEGSAVNFSATVTGSGLIYQWRKGNVNLTNGGNISGANSSSLTINPVTSADAASNYNLLITGICEPSIITTNVSLTVNTAPSIIIAPSSQIICAGSAVSFSVNAIGTGLTYQWRRGTTNLTNWGTISGATSPVLTINPVSSSDEASNYNVIINGTCSPYALSADISLIVNEVPKILFAPVSQSVCVGNPTNFTVVAKGTSLTYQWRKGTTNLINGGNISGATSATLSISPVTINDDASNYNVVVSGACLPNVISPDVSLMANTPPNIIIQPASIMGYNNSSVSLSVSATGTDINYQWRKGTTNLVNGGKISGANSSKLTINPATNADTSSLYNVVISGVCSPIVTSLNASLFICVCPNGINISELGKSNKAASVYPNPFSTSLNIVMNNSFLVNGSELKIYNVSGSEVLNTILSTQVTNLDTSKLPSGIYFYKIIGNNGIIQTGRMIARQ